MANKYSYVAEGEKRDNDDAVACRQKVMDTRFENFSFWFFYALLPGNAQNKIYVRGDNFMFSWDTKKKCNARLLFAYYTLVSQLMFELHSTTTAC